MFRFTSFIAGLMASTAAYAVVPPEIVAQSEVASIAPGTVKNVVAVCPIGKHVTGGGFQLGSSNPAFILQSFPNPDGLSWAVGVQNTLAQPVTTEVSAFAVCM